MSLLVFAGGDDRSLYLNHNGLVQGSLQLIQQGDFGLDPEPISVILLVLRVSGEGWSFTICSHGCLAFGQQVMRLLSFHNPVNQFLILLLWRQPNTEEEAIFNVFDVYRRIIPQQFFKLHGILE